MKPVLTPAEWESLLYQCPDQAKHLLVRLAVAHGHMTQPVTTCPHCQQQREPVQMPLGGVE